MTNTQAILTGPTAALSYYNYLNTGSAGLIVRNGNVLNAQFAIDGSTTIFNNLNIGGLISGIGMNQINGLITNAITT